MLKRILALSFILSLVTIHAIASLKDIYVLRLKTNAFLNAKKFDSAGACLSILIKDTIHANAADYLSLSCCCLHLRDTAGFKKHLIYSIENGGADSSIMHLYFRSLDSNDQVFFKKYLTSVLPKYRAKFLEKIDPKIEKEMNEINFLDQICRKSSDKAYPHDTGSLNFKYLKSIGHYIDSVNYDRVVDLIKRKKYPGFHNFGINSADYDPVLMHVSDLGEAQWNFIYDFVKQQLNCGDMMHSQIVAIATRHYRYKDCTYFGILKWGLTTPCDCEHVDKFRDEIGLDSLREEFLRLGQKLPDCYQK